MLPLLFACTESTLAIGGPEGPPSRRPDGGDTVEDAGGATSPGDTADTGPAPDDSLVFHLDALHTVDITIDTADVRRLGASPYEYVPGEVTFDGETFPRVGIRLKGRLGSYRTLDAKAALKLDFLEYDGERLQGLEKLNLNNMVQDYAKVHELASYGTYRLVGIPAPRVAYAEVTVNGEPFGLYSVVEDYDDVFLGKNFADSSGNLYDGDYYLWSNGSYTLVDFTAAGQDYFVLDEGTDVALADVYAVTAAAADTGTPFGTGVGALVDLDQHAAFVAVTAWTGQADSYCYYSNNYRVYFDPERDGKAVFLPWDPDWAFGTTDVNAGYGVITSGCLRDTACREGVMATVDTLNATVATSSVAEDVETAIALIEPALRRDPRLEQGVDGIHASQDELRSWLANRASQLAAYGW